MTTPLSVVSCGYGAARSAARHLPARSLRLCTALLSTPDLPTETSARTHRLAASVAASSGRYAVARRHLRSAVRFDPAHAATHFHLGQAYDRDPFGSDERAMKHFRAAARLDRTDARYRAAFGRSAVRAGRRDVGVRALVRAANRAPSDAAVLTLVVDGLLSAGRVRAAERVVIRARFLAHHDVRIVGLWDRVRYARASTGQRHARPARVLPFVRVLVASDESESRRVRLDGPSEPQPHFRRG